MKTSLVLIVALFMSLTVNAQSVLDKSISSNEMSLEARSIGILCTSQDKKMVLQGQLPKDTNEGDLLIKLGAEIYKLVQNSNFGSVGVTIHTVEDVLSGVFTVSVKDSDISVNQREVSLSAIPKTMTGTYINGTYSISFKAKFSFFKASPSASCENGCIVMPIEAEQNVESISKQAIVTCQAQY